MPRTRSRIKKVSYVLQVSCNKPADLNEKEFLEAIRSALFHHGIGRDGSSAAVSVIKRTEEFLTAPTKEK